MNKTTILDSNLALVQHKIQKLNRRAVKLGLQPLELRVLGEEYQKHPEREGFLLKYLFVELVGEAPKVAGWEFVAAIDHLEAGNIVRVLVDEQLPAHYRTALPTCEHCNRKRSRQSTFALRNELGEWKQVGRTCLKDFLGHDATLAIIKAGFLSSAMEAMGGGDPSGRHPLTHVELQRYLSAVAAAIRQYGWVASGRQDVVENMRMPTCQRALNGLLRSNRDEVLVIEEQDESLARVALQTVTQHLAGKTALGNYEHNIQVIASSPTLALKSKGYAASILPFYHRLTATAKPKADVPVSNYIGDVGKRSEFKLKLERVVTLPATGFGPSYLLRFVDTAGNAAVWFTGAARNNYEEGQEYTLAATVKKQEEFRGVKQTTLTRCKEVTK